jgi:hypothetical protein
VYRRSIWLAALSLCLAAAGCVSNPSRTPPIDQGFVGAVQLILRQDLTPRAKPVATLKFGDPVEILAIRRRFARIRSGEVEGWADARRLLTRQQMNTWESLNRYARDLPSQGRAKVFSVLNVHTEAYRQAPTFYQLQEEEFVDLIGLKSNRRDAAYAAPPFAQGPRKVQAEEPAPFELSLPLPPPPPADWLARSVPKLPPPLPGRRRSSREKDLALAQGPKVEDWALIRLKDGRAGWVLTNPLFMDLPDDVLQYADRRRVTSYFVLNTVEDREQGPVNEYLWTTISGPGLPYQFDSVRVFVWNRQRHRYEVAYRESNLAGYYPVSVASKAAGGRATKTFTLITEKDGTRIQRTFSFEDGRVRLIDTAKL